NENSVLCPYYISLRKLARNIGRDYPFARSFGYYNDGDVLSVLHFGAPFRKKISVNHSLRAPDAIRFLNYFINKFSVFRQQIRMLLANMLNTLLCESNFLIEIWAENF